LELTHASLPVTVFSFGRVPITRVDKGGKLSDILIAWLALADVYLEL